MERAEQLLLDAVLSGKSALFLGAGASATSIMADGRKMPLGNKLAEITYHRFYPTEKYENESLQLVCSMIVEKYGQSAIREFFLEIFDNLKPSVGLRNLARFKWHNLYTTNIEQAIEIAYQSEEDKAQEIIPVVGPRDNSSEDINVAVTLHKLHGCITRPDVRLVFSLEEYATYKDNHLKLFDKLTIDLLDRPVIFIGYSMIDSNFQELWSTINKYCKTTSLPNRYFYVSPFIKESLLSYLESKNIHCIKMSIDELGAFLIHNSKGKRETLQSFYTRNVPPVEVISNTKLNEKDKYELGQDFVFPLLEMKKAPSRDSGFFKGSEPTWGDIKNNFDAGRDILPIMLNDFDEWELKPHYQLWVITGRAGDGKSTLLKRFSVELSNRLGETVLFASFRADINPERLLNLLSEIGKPIVLFIDNITDRMRKVIKLIQVVKSKKSKLLIIGASRTSEWHLVKQEVFIEGSKEYKLDKISDLEIGRILDKLEKNNALDRLALVNVAAREEIFKRSAERELIVALREATSNQGFDDIIASDFAEIKNEIAQDAFLSISMIHQFRYKVPQSLLFRMYGHADLYQNVFKFTEGILYAEDTRDGQDCLVSSRHPVIAEVVVRLFAKTDLEKYEIIENILNNIIPSNQLEWSLVKKIYHHSTISSLFTDTSVGVNCYNLLLSHFEDDSFLFQQKALFLADVKMFKEASETIEWAIRKFPTSNILTNTHGTILMNQSISLDDIVMSRYLRDKGKNILIVAIKKGYHNTNLYNYHSLINHLITWYKKFESDDNIIEDIQRLLEEAIKHYPNDSNITVEIGRLEEILNNRPSAKAYFNKAIELSPKNMAARFLLAKIFYREKFFKNAYDICEGGLNIKEDEVLLGRLKLEIMHRLEFNVSEISEAYLKYTKFNKNDSFIKLCFAAYLYINKSDFCEKYFAELRKLATLNSREKHIVQDSVNYHINVNDFTETGRVVNIGNRNMIETERFKTTTKVTCTTLSQNKRNYIRVRYLVKFNYMGPVAIKLSYI